MESDGISEEDFSEDLSGIGDPTNSVTMDYSLINHEKDLLLEKTRTQESEIMALRLKVESYEKQKLEAQESSADLLNLEDKTSMEREIDALRGKVALLERNNKIFSNEERTELKRELERTKRRFKHLNEQLSSIRNSMEYDHINHVERALENFVKRVKTLEKENNDLRKKNVRPGAEGEESSKLIEEQEEIIKDKDVMIEELQHRLNSMISPHHDERAEVPPIDLSLTNEETARHSLRRRETSQRGSRPGSRSRRTSERTKRFFSETDAVSSNSTGSDSDVRAVREMCGKMRKDIEEAKQKLKDMGVALEIPQHAAPMHFPMRVYTSPIFDTARVEERVEVKEFPPVTSGFEGALDGRLTSKRRGSDSQALHRTEEEYSASSPRLPVDLRKSWPSDFYATRITKPMSSNFNRHSWSVSVPVGGEKPESANVERIKKMQSGQDRTISRPDNFVHLVSRYEFLRVKFLDYRLLEEEQECTREDYLEFLKSRPRRSKKMENTNEKNRDIRASEQDEDSPCYYCTNGHVRHAGESCVPAAHAEHGVSQILSTVPRNYINTSNSAENESLRTATYRVYVAKRQYFPSEEEKKTATVFSKIRLHAGDVVTSLGAPETLKDGKRYQLVEVNDKIGLVPLSHLQLAEEVYQAGRNRRVKRAYLTSTLRRIPDLYKRLHDRRRIMHCGV